MTVSSTTSEISYAGDGVTVAFAIPFQFGTASDLYVTSTDAAGNIAQLTSGFSVAGGNGGTGTLTFLVAPVAGITITIIDQPEFSQTTDYASNDAFPADAHERALDKGVRISKWIKQQLNRCLRTALGDPITDLTLGSVDNRRGKYLFFNAVTGAIEYAVSLGVTVISQSIIGALLFPQNEAEAAVGLVPIRYLPYGDVRRHCVADLATDDTVKFNLVLDAVRYAVSHPGSGAKFVSFDYGAGIKVSGSCVVTGVDIRAAGDTVHIQAAAGMTVPVLISAGGHKQSNLRVDGAGTGAAGQLGDILQIVATAPAYPYINRIENPVYTNARRDGVHIERGGYTAVYGARALGAGRHPLRNEGTDFVSNSTTTFETNGKCQWSSAPNESGAYFANSACCQMNGDIIEATTGAAIKIRGDNRAFSCLGVYAENTGSKFIDWTGATGIGMLVLGCFGGNAAVDYNPNWEHQWMPLKGNSNITLPAPAHDANNYVDLPVDEMIRDVADPDDFTLKSGGADIALTLASGDWYVELLLQTRINANAPTLAVGSIVLTTNAADSGLADATNTFVAASDMARSVPSANCRLKAWDEFTIGAATTYYPRCHLDFTGAASKIAVAGRLRARRKN